MPVRWRAAPDDDLLWADWGSDVALHHRPSGLTHFVDRQMLTLLREVLVSPRTTLEAAEALARAQGAELHAEYVSGIAMLLDRLDSLGLVEREPG